MCWPYSLHWVEPSEATGRGAWLLNYWPRVPLWWWWWCWWWWFSSPSSSLSPSSPSHLTSSSPSILLPIRCDSSMPLLNTLDASQQPRDEVQPPCMAYENFFSLFILISCHFPTNHSIFQPWMIFECAMLSSTSTLWTCCFFIQGCCLQPYLPPSLPPFGYFFKKVTSCG